MFLDKLKQKMEQLSLVISQVITLKCVFFFWQTIAKAVGDWYHDRCPFQKIDNSTYPFCHNSEETLYPIEKVWLLFWTSIGLQYLRKEKHGLILFTSDPWVSRKVWFGSRNTNNLILCWIMNWNTLLLMWRLKIANSFNSVGGQNIFANNQESRCTS